MRKKNCFKRTLAVMSTLVMGLSCMTGCISKNDDKTPNTSSIEIQDESTNAVTNDTEAEKPDNQYADTITLVWYPNESADTYSDIREEVGRLIEGVTGKKVEQKLTTDYAIAIEALSNGTAQIGCCMGGEGYIQAKNANDAVDLLFVNSDANGTLDEAMYYSFFAVLEENAADYASGDTYSIDNIQGKKMSFVSNSSTSGFKVPTNAIIEKFGATAQWSSLTVDDLIEGGKDAFFGEVLFGGSHQGSAFNLMSGKSDVSAFCDIEINPYATLVEGEACQVGAVYEIKADADAPFDTVTGKRFTVISSTPVMNGPFAYNGDTLSPEDVAKIQNLFTSDEVANNTKLFYHPDTEESGMYKKTKNERFVLVEDSWYDPIRNMK